MLAEREEAMCVLGGEGERKQDGETGKERKRKKGYVIGKRQERHFAVASVGAVNNAGRAVPRRAGPGIRVRCQPPGKSPMSLR